MMVRVPSRGFAGLGQDTEAGIFDSGGGTTIDLPTFGDTLPVIDINGNGALTLGPTATQAGLTEVGGVITTPIDFGTCVGSGCTASLAPLTAPNAPAPTQSQLANIVSNGTASGLSAAQIAQLVASAANAGVSVLKATSSPYAIPGTNLVYNPATGQILPSSGLLNTASTLGTSMMPVLLIGAAVLGLVLVMSKK